MDKAQKAIQMSFCLSGLAGASQRAESRKAEKFIPWSSSVVRIFFNYKRNSNSYFKYINVRITLTSKYFSILFQEREDFLALLREHPDIDGHSGWTEVKKHIDSDSRYRIVGSSPLREEHFIDYCKMLKDERKRCGSKDISSEEKDGDQVCFSISLISNIKVISYPVLNFKEG